MEQGLTEGRARMPFLLQVQAWAHVRMSVPIYNMHFAIGFNVSEKMIECGLVPAPQDNWDGSVFKMQCDCPGQDFLILLQVVAKL